MLHLELALVLSKAALMVNRFVRHAPKPRVKRRVHVREIPVDEAFLGAACRRSESLPHRRDCTPTTPLAARARRRPSRRAIDVIARRDRALRCTIIEADWRRLPGWHPPNVQSESAASSRSRPTSIHRRDQAAPAGNRALQRSGLRFGAGAVGPRTRRRCSSRKHADATDRILKAAETIEQASNTLVADAQGRARAGHSRRTSRTR